jgi:phosphatidylcholine synthase
MPVSRAKLAAAFAVHIFTAFGAVVAFGALVAAIQGEFTAMFGLLGIALVIDGVDGSLARSLRVAELLPRWSGETLDHVVDYLTYVFVPAFALASGGILPMPFAIPAAVAILLSSAIYFADNRMKTSDGYFRGFPALWNIAVFYLFLARPAPAIAVAIVAALVVLTFAPVYFAHPLRARGMQMLNVAFLIAGAALALAALFYHMSPPTAVVYGLYAVAAYFAAIGFMRPADREN